MNIEGLRPSKVTISIDSTISYTRLRHALSVTIKLNNPRLSQPNWLCQTNRGDSQKFATIGLDIFVEAIPSLSFRRYLCENPVTPSTSIIGGSER